MVEKRIKLLQYDKKIHLPGEDHTRVLSMEVCSVEQLGTDSYLYGNLKNGTSVTIHSPGQTSVTPGQTIVVGADVEMMQLFDTSSGNTLHTD